MNRMKKLIAILLVLMMVLAVAACGKDEDKKDSDKKDSKKNETTNPGKDDNPVADGIVKSVIGDQRELRPGVQAHDSWYAVSVYRVYEFDADGKCTRNEDVYTLGDPANKDEADAHLTGANWKPVWSADGKSFSLADSTSYTDLEDAYEYFNSHYYAYTIQYASGSKHVDVPSDADKIADMQKIYGFTPDDIKGAIGEYNVVAWQRDAMQMTSGEAATLDKMNDLCAKLFEICKPLAEDGTMYTYLGKYGDVLTEAPKETSEFNNAEFHYFRDGKEVKVSVGIDQKGEKTLTIYIGIVK